MTGLPALNFFFSLIIFFLPGFGFLLIFKDIPRHPVLFVTEAFGISIAWNLMVSLILLYFGIYSEVSLWLGALVPFAVGFGFWFIWSKNSPIIFKFDYNATENIPCLLVVITFCLVLMFTPKWNFLISPNMDAGNYETYANHFWQTGNLYWDISDYLQHDIPLDWLTSRNTWVFELKKEIAMPVYLYGFPVLLGIAKTLFGSPSVSWGVNAFFALLSIALITMLAVKLSGSRIIGALLALIACFSPLFFYYSKQIMAEMPALFGFLLMLFGMGYRFEKGGISGILATVAGLSILLQVKLDAYIVPTLMLIGFGFTLITTKHRIKEFKPDPYLYLSIGLTVFLNSTLVIGIANTYYLKHFSLNLPKIPGQPFLFIYGVIIFVGFAFFPIIMEGYDKYTAKRQSLIKISSWIITGCFACIWLSFFFWNLSLRPIGQDLKSNHDAFNLIRLFAVFSPFFISSLFFTPLSVYKVSGFWKVVLVAGGLGLIYLIYKSNHSPPEIWWMRRYLTFIVPTSVLNSAVLFIFLKSIFGNNLKKYFVALLIGFLFFQALQVRPLLAHKVNEDAVTVIKELSESVPESSLLIAVKGNSIFRGTMNTFRTLRKGPTLLNIPIEKISAAKEYYSKYNFSIISPTTLNEWMIRDMGLHLVKSGYFYRQWANQLESIKKKPAQKTSSPYFLYVN